MEGALLGTFTLRRKPSGTRWRTSAQPATDEPCATRRAGEPPGTQATDMAPANDHMVPLEQEHLTLEMKMFT
jgi:hypothetical protein